MYEFTDVKISTTKIEEVCDVYEFKNALFTNCIFSQYFYVGKAILPEEYTVPDLQVAVHWDPRLYPSHVISEKAVKEPTRFKFTEPTAKAAKHSEKQFLVQLKKYSF